MAYKKHMLGSRATLNMVQSMHLSRLIRYPLEFETGAEQLLGKADKPWRSRSK